MTPWQQLLDRQQGMATRSQLLAAGLPRSQLEPAAGRLRRTGPGVYADRPLPPRGTHLLTGGVPDEGYVAQLRHALLQLGGGARAARRTAAVVHGLDMAVEPATVEVDLTRGRRLVAPDGVEVRSTRRARSQLVAPLAGLAPVRVPPVDDVVLDCAAELPLDQAVAIADSALRRRRCTRADLQAALMARTGLAGDAQLRAVLRWVDVRSGSVLESLLRVLLCSNGIAAPATQLVLRDPATGECQRVDFAWPQQRLVVEADGRRFHDPDDRRDADRRRDNLCARLGWTVLRFTWADVVHRPASVVAEVQAALSCRTA